MITIQRKEDCVGCASCIDICTHDALTFETDIEGNWYPKIDTSKCIDCGVCEKVCPVLQSETIKEGYLDTPICYAAINKDNETRIASTSGGIFSVLANKIYESKGFVGGAVYLEDFSLQHIISENKEDLNKIRGSKHFQSNTLGYF
ncbi:MAG: 4Fe-4S binding protein, partial [Endomicrobiia bacterium]